MDSRPKTHVRASAVTAHRVAARRRSRAIATQGRRPPREQDRALYRVADRAAVSRETAGSVVTVALSVIGEALASDETAAIARFGTFSNRWADDEPRSRRSACAGRRRCAGCIARPRRCTFCEGNSCADSLALGSPSGPRRCRGARGDVACGTERANWHRSRHSGRRSRTSIARRRGSTTAVASGVKGIENEGHPNARTEIGLTPFKLKVSYPRPLRGAPSPRLTTPVVRRKSAFSTGLF